VGNGTESQKNHAKVKDNPEKGMIVLSTFTVTQNCEMLNTSQAENYRDGISFLEELVARKL
jgi:hypothetical protein